tara:strand:- start:320 stop:511 length:192 start_codon:yes stop_codon:yes gene_type:complete
MQNNEKQPTVVSPIKPVVSCDFDNTTDLDLEMVRDMQGIPSVSNMHKFLIAQELIKNGWVKSN